MTSYSYRYTNNFSDIAAELLVTIPWYSWPKNKVGELLYDSVLALAYYSPRTVDAWAQKHPDCVYDVSRYSDTDAWYWIANWASRNTIDWYTKGNYNE